MTITGLNYNEATKYLDEANYHVKTALVMILANVPLQEAKDRLVRSDGFVRRAINEVKWQSLLKRLLSHPNF